MANNPQLANATATTAANAVTTLLNTGFLRIYDGTQPATADTAIVAQTLLAELTFNATAAPSASNGVATFNAIGSEAAALANGTASWARLFASNGTTVVADCTVGTSGCDINLNTTTIATNDVVAVSSFTYTQSKT